MPFTPGRDALARMFPRALPNWLDALARLAPMMCEHYRVTRLEWCHMMGQVAAETDGLSIREMTEDMRYTSAARILDVFGYRLGLAIAAGTVFGRRYRSKLELARALVNQPAMLADVVYGGPHGREGTPPWQGSRYIGRGPLQATHLNGYREVRDEIRLQPGGDACPDLVAHPEVLATDADMGVRAFFAGWHVKGLRRWALADDCDTLSDVLNTGNARDAVKPNGLPRRRRETARAKGIWPSVADDTPPEAAGAVLREGMGRADGDAVHAAVKDLQALLVGQGYAVGAVDGEFRGLTRRAVVAFQAEHGLAPDGDMDAHDMEVLRSTAPADLGARATASDVPGSQQIAAGRGIERTGQMGLGLGGTEAVGQSIFGVSPFGWIMDVIGQAGAAVTKVTALGVKIDPRMGVALVLLIGGPTLWRYGRQTRIARLVAHRLGLNLSR